jgi:hypothetical protein
MTEIVGNEPAVATPAAEAALVTKSVRSKPTAASASKPRREPAAASKTDLVLKKLRQSKGATLQQLIDGTGWQQHSVRGFLSGTVKKKLGLELVSETGKDGQRRYRIVEAPAAA